MVTSAEGKAETGPSGTARGRIRELLQGYISSLNRYPTPNSIPLDPNKLHALQDQEALVVRSILLGMPVDYTPSDYLVRMNPCYSYETYVQGHFLQTFPSGLREACFLNEKLGLRIISIPEDPRVNKQV